MLKTKQKNGIFLNLDPVLFSCTVALSLISILTIFGAMDNFGTRKLIMQIAMTVSGLIATVVVAQLDYRWIIDKLWLAMISGRIKKMIEPIIIASHSLSIIQR